MIPAIRRRVLFTISFVIAACGTYGTEPSAPSITETTFAPTLGVNLSAMTRTTNGTYVRDLVVGTGAVVAAGQEISVRYSGWLANGTLFDSVQPSAAPAIFRIGVGGLIAGWDEGIPGMRVGGRRQLVVPPSMGYGPGPYGSIPGNSILVFTVDMVSAR
ncbi:MAG TPA: FKBP-type peptidyl-prolyl cis-trans isomerase [Gemmatimonadaceae bacterium]|nr:FKBP-type peptidyl-prolyl cis-trans isomerase [Gemmatimonadaceae bacterium]